MLQNYRRVELPNGLRVLAVENPDLHAFACSAHVRAGARFEPPERTGLSHFVEHMLMQGSENYPSFSDIMRQVEDLGGVVEGQTYPEHVKVTFGVHRKHWRRLLDVAADVVLRPVFDATEVEQEKSIIAEEISHYRDKDGRNISVFELAYELLMKEVPHEAGTRGSLAILEGFDSSLVREHYEKFFVPQNMVLCLAGGFDVDQVLSEATRYFGATDGAAGAPVMLPPELASRRTRALYRATEALPVAEAALCFHAYPLGDSKFDALRAVGALLGGGLTSRLFSRVREELGLVYDISSYPYGFSDVGALYATLSVSLEHLVSAFEGVLGVLREAAGEGFTDAELERYKESVRCGMDMLCDHPAHVADWFARQELFLGRDDVVGPEEYVARQEKLTLDTLWEVAKAVLLPESANLAVAGPFGEDQIAGLRQRFPAEEAR